MTSEYLKKSRTGSRIVDLAVLTFSFSLFVYLTGIPFTQQIAVDLLLYVSVVFICLRLAKRVIFEHFKLSRRILLVLLGNVTGLIIGGLIVLLANLLFPGFQESLLVVVLSSIMAFFVLGTISPMIKSSNNDIVQYR